jgi:transcriptional regulator with XRE-family HTH domain
MARGNFGEKLKRERELREVTLEEITSATRISGRFLEALENEDWEKLPGGAFNRGFVRSVARYLGLDEEAFLGEYDLARGTQVPPPEEHPENRIPSPPRWLPAAVVLGALVLLAGLIVGGIHAWRYFGARRAVKHSHASRTPLLPQPTPQVWSAAGGHADAGWQANFPDTFAATSLDLSVCASAATRLWVRSDGNLVFDKPLRAREYRPFTSPEGFDVSAADSAAVLLELNGPAITPLGLPGSSGTMRLGGEDLR